MSFYKYAVPALALVASAAAQSCSFSSTTTISNPAGASALAACTTVSGSVVIATGAASGGKVEIGNVESIDGALTYLNDNQVNNFNMPSLTTVTGAMNLQNLSALTGIGLGSLTQTGDFTLMNCGQLSSLGLTKGLQSAGALIIRNTYLQNLGGLSNLTKVLDIKINGNPLLADITLDVGQANNIDIGSNEVQNKGLAVTFTNLTQASSITIQNATNVNFPTLQTVAGNFDLIFNSFTNFSLPSITSAGGLIMNSNAQLVNISFPQLAAVNGTNGTFQLANNTQLTTLAGFPALTTVSGAVTFFGTFMNGTISQFKRIGGALIIASSNDITDICNQATTLHSSQVYTAKTNCVGKSATASGTTSGSGSSSSSGTSASSSAAAVPMTIPTISLSAGVGAALLQFLLSF